MIEIPDRLRRALGSDDAQDWLGRLPTLVAAALERWQLDIAGPPYEGGSCAWVAPVLTGAGEDAVLKITWPHPEAAPEAAALRWWDGHGAIRLLADDAEDWAMLLEVCRPGTPLRDSPIDRAAGLDAAATVLTGLWDHAVPDEPTQFPLLATACAEWADVGEQRRDRYAAELAPIDPGLVRAGLELLRTLPGSADRLVVLHGDANPGNLLAAERAAYLAIDPKPLVGDPAFDPWPMVGQLGVPEDPEQRAAAQRQNLVGLAERIGLDPARVAAWGVARDVEAGLWAVSLGDVDDGLDWIGAAADVAELAGL